MVFVKRGLDLGDAEQIEDAVQVVERVVLNLDSPLIVAFRENPDLRTEFAL